MDDVGIAYRRFCAGKGSGSIKMQPMKDCFCAAGFCAAMEPIGRQNQELSSCNCKVLAVLFHKQFALMDINQVKGMGEGAP